MPIVNQFYNGSTRKYIALFGTLFNKISITREDNSGNEIQRLVVPISYGPYQKFLARISQDPNLNEKTGITLPRMAFDITAINYDGTRKRSSTHRLKTKMPTNNGSADFYYEPVPYEMTFNLYIMTKYSEDGSKILEQILPFFQPELTTAVKLIDGLDPVDIPLQLNDVTFEDTYESDFITRRSLLWTLSFTMKVFFYGPKRNKKIIKFVDVSMINGVDADTLPSESVITQPGLTADGKPTNDLNQTINYQQIEIDDDWGIIQYIEDNTNE